MAWESQEKPHRRDIIYIRKKGINRVVWRIGTYGVLRAKTAAYEKAKGQKLTSGHLRS